MEENKKPIDVSKRNSLTLVLYTDDDFWFRNHRSQYLEDELREDPEFTLDWYEVADYHEHRAEDLMPIYTFAFEFEDEHVDSVVRFLNQLIEDVRSGSECYDYRDFARKALSRMIAPAIDFLESGKRGLFRSAMVNGNWQPSSLVIVREDVKLMSFDPKTGDEEYEMLEGVFELKEGITNGEVSE